MDFSTKQQGSLLDTLLGSKAVKRTAEDVVKAVIASSENKPMTVESFDNHIYFYSGVNSDRCLDLVKTIRQVDDNLRRERISRNIPIEHATPIYLHVNSGGGELFAGLAVADQIKTIQTPIYSIVEGYCASAATFISVACKKRYILPNSFMLIHQLSSRFWGTYSEFQDEQKLLDMAMNAMKHIYVNNTKIGEDEITEFLKHDSWFNANQAIEKGLVDEIWE